MITKTVELYEFDELDDRGKERARRWYIGNPSRSYEFTCFFREMYLDYFFPNSALGVQWEIGRKQTDGVNIYGRLLVKDIINYVENWTSLKHFGRNSFDPRGEMSYDEMNLIKMYISYSDALVNYVELSQNYIDSSCTAGDIQFSVDLIEELIICGIDTFNKKVIYKFEDMVKKIVQSLCEEMLEEGYYELYNVKDKDIQEKCKKNGWYFTKDGKFYSE